MIKRPSWLAKGWPRSGAHRRPAVDVTLTWMSIVIKSMLPVSASTICAIALGFASLLAVQNAQPVTLAFLGAQSVPLPLGVLLIFCAMVGLIGGTILRGLWRVTKR
jgi:uncharacterized integral membrane protein